MSDTTKEKPPVTVKVTPATPPQAADVVETTALVELPDNEIQAQIDVARRYPRDLKKFLAEAKEMVTLSEDIAESCLYRLKRYDTKLQKEVPLIGGSVRLAEICLSLWGNVHAGARGIEEGARYVKAQGVCWDVQRNVRVTMETTRGIMTSGGRRYKDDMVVVTMNAACGIAYRNAAFKVVPLALVEEILECAKVASVGELGPKRIKVVARLGLWGASEERVLASLGRMAVDEITVGDLEILMASGQTLKAGESTVDELFPPLNAPAPAAAATPTPAATPAAAATSAMIDAAIETLAGAAGTGVAGSTPAQAQPGSSDGRAPATAPPPRETTPATVAAASSAAAPATAAPSAGKPKQGTLMDAARRNRPNAAPVDDGGVISRPASHLSSVPEDPEDAANRAAAEPGPDELPPWAGGPQ